MSLTIKKACGAHLWRKAAGNAPRQAVRALPPRSSGGNVPDTPNEPHPWGKISFCRLLGLIYFVKVK
ncbi:hypothetical protein HMPREF3038_00568 [Akkermansia sp. KLE1797]|nr:hypothetical protein HMPREF3038_00568 [Akkermansia sp. KLE1797]KXU55663.1 hypothetical protein HMPREF3039_00133 [Akkermansia sp. KLE1798]KZA04261.1 hypothetical protein HMPREF1326_02064 [Akkermansia sp. KLE1605]